MNLEIGVSSSFKKVFKRKIAGRVEFETLFWKKMSVFASDPYAPSLHTHKLSGILEGLWSFSVSYERRVVFKFLGEHKVLLMDIGSHDEVY